MRSGRNLRAWLLCSALGLLSCRGEALLEAGAALEVSPREVVVGPAWVGERTRAEVELRNTGRAALEVRLAIDAPFLVEPAVTLAGGEARRVELVVVPTAPGPLAATLRLETSAQRLEVPVSAEAATTPTCPTRDCVESTFDPASGRCLERTLPDDAPCGATNQCLVGGHCEAGTCVGRARDCDDGNACTVDACDVATGCRHDDATSACAVPADPCLAATCDPVTGCGAVPVADGTSCGENDCVTARVCMAGACVSRAAPEGSTCAGATTCRGEGVCRAGACALPPLEPMTPRWTYRPAPGRTLTFLGHVDDEGNAYLTEYWLQPDSGEVDVPTTELVSLSPTGQVRFRQRVASYCTSCRWGLGFAVDGAGRRLFLNAQLKVQARSLDDGRLLWTQDLTAGLPAYDRLSDGGASFSSQAPLLLGDTLVGIPMLEGAQDHHAYVRTFDRATGAPEWTLHKKGHLYGTGATSRGDLWTSSANCWAPAGELTRVAPSGVAQATRFVELMPAGTWGWDYGLGAANGKLVRIDEQLSTTDLTAAVGAQSSAQALVSDDELVLWQRGRLEVVDARTLTVRRTATPRLMGQGPDFELLRDGGVGWTATVTDGGVLGAVDGAGAVAFECFLPAPPENPTTITRGQALVASRNTLSAYAVPGLEVAPAGWVAKGGSLGRGKRAR